ncbi:MAG: DNA repair protein RecO [Candidatus Omnitrophota bacterium]
MSIYKTEAIVLNRHDFRETSLIANFYTRDFGKVSGLLKGIRQQPPKFASTCELFSHNEIIFYHKRNSGLHLVSACDLRENFNLIRQDISRVTLASMMMELVAAVMQLEDKNEEVFSLSINCLKELGINRYAEKIATIFKIKFLSLSGFKPHFDSCVCCQDRILGAAKFSLSLGGLLCQGCFKKDTASRTIFRGTVATILHIERNELKDNLNLGLNPQIKKELDIVLNSFINYHLERELKSQKVLNKLAVTAEV